ncbi:MAG: hypothetical protein ACI8TX_002583 [Hyphomicrobiaceae bacterium]
MYLIASIIWQVFCFTIFAVICSTVVLCAGLALIWALEERRGVASIPDRPTPALLVCSILELVATAFAILASPVAWMAPRPLSKAPQARAVAVIAGWGLGPIPVALLAARLRARGRVVHVFHPGTVFNDLDERVELLATALADSFETTGVALYDVVTHGDGGILLRAAANSSPALAERFGNIVTIGAPHAGVLFAHFFRKTRWATLRPGSHWLARLDGEESLADGRRHVTTIASDSDWLVCPTRSAQYDAAFNVRTDLVGHFSLLASERIFDLLTENLEFGVG